MPTFTIDDLPAEIFKNILSYGSFWDLVNAKYVSKSWRNKLKPQFDDYFTLYQSLINLNSSQLIERCRAAVNECQVVFMSLRLLLKLGLDDIISIARHSVGHAEIVFKSRLFQNNKVPWQMKLDDAKDNIQISLAIFPDYLYSKLIPVQNKKTLEPFIKKLIYPQFLETELDQVTEFPFLSHKILCQKYIARAIAEFGGQHLQLAAHYAQNILSVNHWVMMAKANLSHTHVLLKTVALREKLSAEQMTQIAAVSVEHHRVMFDYVVNVVCSVPVQLVKLKPQSISSVVEWLINDSFFQFNNSLWTQLKKKFPNNTKHILEAQKFLDKSTLVDVVLLKMAHLSIEHLEKILMIENIEVWLKKSSFDQLAAKDELYQLRIKEFLLKNENALNEPSSTLNKSF